MDIDYQEFADVTLDLLNSYGIAAKLGERNVLAIRTKTISHALLDSQIQIGDIEYVLDANANPTEGERFEISTESLIVIFKKPVKPADVVIAWIIYGRAG